MADRYWVGGTAAWDGTAGSKWALTSGGLGGEAVPTAADDVFFDGASGVVTCTISTGNTGAKSINCTGFTGTLTGTAAITVSGSVTLVAGMTYTYTGTLTINATGTITSAGKTHGPLTINGSGITATLGDALTAGATRTTTLTAGTLDLNGFTLSTGIFSSSGGVTRSILTGFGGNIALTSTTAGTTVLAMATLTNFTSPTGPVTFTRNQAATATVTFGTTGGTAARAANLTVNAGASALTITTSSYFNNINFTGSTCTVSDGGASNIAGNLTLASGGTYSLSPTFTGSGTITSNGRGLSNTTINGSGITVTLADAHSTGTFSLLQGTFTAANFNVTAVTFSSSGTLTRTLNMGSGTWTITGPGVLAWNIGTTTGLTLNPSTSTITMTNASAKTFTGGSLTYYNLAQGGAGALTIIGNNTFNTLSSSVTTTDTTVSFTNDTTQTVTNFNFTGTAPFSTILQSSTSGSTFTLSKSSGTVNVTRCVIRDSIATGGATWNATESRSIVNNTGWNITTPANPDRYWVGGTASWDGTAGSKWALTSGGSGGATMPGLVENAFLNGASGASTVTIATGNLGASSLNCAGFTGTLAGTSSISIYGSVTLGSGSTVTYNGVLSLLATATLTCAGKTLLGNFIYNSVGTTLTLGDACTLAAAAEFNLIGGILNLNGFTLSTGTFVSSNSNTRAIIFGAANIALTSTTAATTVLAMPTVTNFTMSASSGGFTRNMAATATVTFGTTGGTTSNAPNLTVNAGASALTISTNSYFRNVNFTGSTSTVSAGVLFMAGNLTLASGGTYTSVNPNFQTSATITNAGRTLGSTTINGSGITVTLADAMTLGSTTTLTLNQGTFTTANFNVTVGSFSSISGNTRTLNMGSSTWTVLGTGSTAWDISTTIGLTLNPSTSTINMQGTAAKTFAGGGLTYYNLNQSAAARLTISGNNTFNTLSSSVTTADTTVRFTAGSTQTVTNFNFTGTAPFSIFLDSSVSGSTFTLSDPSGTITVSRCVISDSIATGGATWNAVESKSLGNNTGWNITAPANPDRYWVGGTASWDGTAGTKWALTSGGSGGATVPGAVENAFLDGASGVNTVTIATGNLGAGSLNCTGFTGTLAGTIGISVYGSITLVAGMTYTYTGVLTIGATGTITSAGKTFGSLTIDAAGGGTVTLGDALTTGTTNTTTLTNGTLNLNGFTLSTGAFSSNNLNTRSIIFGSANIALTSTTAATLVLGMANATGFTFTGTGGFTRNQAATATVQFGSSAGGTVSTAPDLRITTGSSTLAITAGSWFKNLIFSTGGTSTVSTSTLNIAGNLTLAGGTYTSFVPTFWASGTITSNGRSIGNITIDAPGGTVTVNGPLTLEPITTSTATLTNGTLALNGNLTTGLFSSSNSNTRSINFGSNSIIMRHEGFGVTALSMATATNFTCTDVGGGFVRDIRSSAQTFIMSFGTTGGTVSNAPNLVFDLNGTSMPSCGIVTGSWFKNFSVVGSLNGFIFSGTDINIAGNYTVNVSGSGTELNSSLASLNITFRASGSISSLGGATLGDFTINAPGSTVTLANSITNGTLGITTLTEGTLNLNGFTLSTGRFISNNSNTREITFGSGNIALISATSAATVLDMATATNFTWTGTGGFTRSMALTSATVQFGSTAGGTVSNAPNLTVNAGSNSLVYASGSWFKNLNFTGSSSTINPGEITGVNIAGNLTLASGGSYTFVAPTFRASGTVTSAGRTLASTTINGSGITVTLADAMTLESASTLTLLEGTFNAANFNVTVGSFSSNNSNTRTLNMGSGIWRITGSGTTAWNTDITTGFTLNPSTSTIRMTNASAKTFAGGGLTYYNLDQGGAGALTISGSNTFNNITYTVVNSTVTFTAGTTQTVSNFSLATGYLGNLVTINSTIPGSQFTLSKSSGTINAQYLAIQDSNATGGATWNSLLTNGNVNNGNNTGWIFSLAGGNMLLMFI